jgi:hypothetical protein
MPGCEGIARDGAGAGAESISAMSSPHNVGIGQPAFCTERSCISTLKDRLRKRLPFRQWRTGSGFEDLDAP